MKYVIAAAAMSCLTSDGAHAAAPVSHIPADKAGQILAEHFDLATIRSSMNPRRTAAQRTFKDLGLRPTSAGPDGVTFDSAGDWFYQMKILERRDVNRDGIEDLLVCFTEHAQNGGNYRSSRPLLITRYAVDGYAVALSFSVDSKECASYP